MVSTAASSSLPPVDPESTVHVAVHVQRYFFHPNPLYARPSEIQRQSKATAVAHKIDETAHILYDEGIPTCWICMENDDIGEAGELYIVRPQECDVVASDNERSAIKTSSVLKTLKRQGIKTLIITGGYASECVTDTVIDALDAGFQVIVATDCLADNTDDMYLGGMQASKNRKSLFFCTSGQLRAHIASSRIAAHTQEYAHIDNPSGP